MVKIKCPRCNDCFKYDPSKDARWDFTGLDYDTKYVVCPNCGRIIIMKYEEYDIDINNDQRFYNYTKEKNI